MKSDDIAWRCVCWGWATADESEVEDLIDYGHRPACPMYQEEELEVVWELDGDLAAEILATYDDEEDE